MGNMIVTVMLLYITRAIEHRQLLTLTVQLFTVELKEISHQALVPDHMGQ